MDHWPVPGIAGAILLYSVILLWPTLFVGTALTFNDSFYYVGRGEIALSNLLDSLLPPSPGAADAVVAGSAPHGTEGDAAKVDSDGAKVRRSLPYQMFAGLTAATIPTGGLLTVWLQSLVLTIFIACCWIGKRLRSPGRSWRPVWFSQRSPPCPSMRRC
jgi:hypothetical protein